MLEAERPTYRPKEPPCPVEQAERRVQSRHSARPIFRLRTAAHPETASLELLRLLPLCKRIPLFDLRHALRFLRDARMLPRRVLLWLTSLQAGACSSWCRSSQSRLYWSIDLAATAVTIDTTGLTKTLISFTAVSSWFPPSNSPAWILPERMPSAATILLTTAHPAASVAAVPSVENKLYSI